MSMTLDEISKRVDAICADFEAATMAAQKAFASDLESFVSEAGEAAEEPMARAVILARIDMTVKNLGAR